MKKFTAYVKKKKFHYMKEHRALIEILGKLDLHGKDIQIIYKLGIKSFNVERERV